VLLGPSIEWRPTPRTHLSVVPLLGLTHDSPVVEAFIVFSFQLTKPAEPTLGRAPTALRSR
jgi:hypothetical protein